jgi:imidazolonepropionase-like amidohydrolase
MTLAAPIGMCLAWPSLDAGGRGFGRAPAPDERRRELRERQLRELEQAFTDARAYRTAKQARRAPGVPAPRTDERWEAMIPVLDGKLPLLVEADDLQAIEEAVAFAERQGARLILYGGYDAPLCAELLRRHEVPVIVRSTQRLPLRRSDPYDAPLCLPNELASEDIPFCIANGGGFSNERNLPYQAAAAMSCGLEPIEALRAVTLYPARILGVAERVGSLEVGKDATLILTDGDPLALPTQVRAAFVQGRRVDLEDKQKALYRKYAEKHRRYAGARAETPGGSASRLDSAP